MTIAANNKILQSSVDYIALTQAGAVSQDRNSKSYDIDSAMPNPTTFTYGEFVKLGNNKGAAKIESASTTVGTILGVVKYEDSGVIDAAGYETEGGLYTNIPVLKQGVILVNSTGTINLGDTLYLYIDASDTANYGKIKAGSGSGAIDISTIAKPYAKSSSANLTLIDVNII